MGERTLRLARHLGGLVRPADGGTDADLLGLFISDRDEAAFAQLVRRHGPMVLGVCRRVLGDVHAADDAFQATFLVLARRARSLRDKSRLGNWLFGVAHRTALEARRRASLRRAKERRAAAMNAEARMPEEVGTDLRDVLDQELALLPDSYRAAVVACELEGLSRAEAARRLGWPEGTLSCRLARARVLLAQRLSKYGSSVAGAAPVGTAPVLGSALVASTARAAALAAAGHSVAGVVPVAALELSQGVMKAMLVNKLKGAVAGLMVVTAVAWTGAAGSWPAASAGPQDQPTGKAAGGKQATRDRDAERIAQLERERDELRKKLADALDRLVALEAQVREERERVKVPLTLRDGLPLPLGTEGIPGTTDTASVPGLPQPPGATPAGGVRRAGSAANAPRPPGSVVLGYGVAGTNRPAPSVLKVYRVGDLAADEKQAEAVVRVIRSLVEPESWNGSGGSGVIEYFVAKKVLLVRQTPEVHQQVDALVRLLMESGDSQPRPIRGAPAVRP